MNRLIFTIGLGLCTVLGCAESQPVEFENETYDVYVRHVVETMERITVDEYMDVPCEELCYTIAGQNTNEYNITECFTQLYETVFEGEVETWDGNQLAGTLSCTGSVLNFEK